MIRALIFDFDGLILDTETPEFLVWQSIYMEHGHELPAHEWSKIVGGYGISNFDAAEHLTDLTQGQLDAVSLRARHQVESSAAIADSPILPGVENIIHAAKKLGLKLAIASSSPHTWVDTHTKRLGIFDYFDKVICAEDVLPGRTKPNPDLFLKALDQLKVQKNKAVVFEDSPNGVKAAQSAGIFVVLVTNPTTSSLEFEGEYLRLNSLADLRLSDLLQNLKDKNSSA
ncbi:MAG: HAD-IA family hydrolase [Anaerolineales bacterium]|nr:HAD-IA family hydrolase [Anaerolineales bacterium]